MKKMFKNLMFIAIVLSTPLFFASCDDDDDNPANYSESVKNLQAAITGETGASATYTAFAAKAKEDGYLNIAKMFEAAAAAEKVHINNHNKALVKMGETEFSVTPSAGAVKSTKENLQSGIDGETYEFTEMYPEFLLTAKKEKSEDAEKTFKYAQDAEEIHAELYTSVLELLNEDGDDSSVSNAWYVCPICGNLHSTIEGVSNCAICRAPSSSFLAFVVGAETINNLQAAITGETGASAKYTAFADKAAEDGYPNIAKMFKAAAAAENVHIKNHNKVLVTMGAQEFTVTPTPAEVKSTKENLQSGIDGETYEFTEMYPAFLLVAEAESNPDAIKTFRFAKDAEEVHAGLYANVLESLNADSNDSNISDAWYVCPICGNLHSTIEGVSNCVICGALSSSFEKF